MIGIKSYEFLKKLYGYLNNQKNQGTFVIEFFNAAGSRYFTMPASYASRTNDYLEAERRYVKDRSLTMEIKASFPNPVDVDGLTGFIAKNLKQNELLLCMVDYKVGRLWKFKLSEVDEWIRSGGASDENNTENNEQA